MGAKRLVTFLLSRLFAYGETMYKCFCGRVPWLNQYWPGDFLFLWFYVQELPKAQLAVVLVLKRLRRRVHGLKSHPTDWEKPGIEPATPGLQDIGLSPTPRRLHILHVIISYEIYYYGELNLIV